VSRPFFRDSVSESEHCDASDILWKPKADFLRHPAQIRSRQYRNRLSRVFRPIAEIRNCLRPIPTRTFLVRICPAYLSSHQPQFCCRETRFSNNVMLFVRDVTSSQTCISSDLRVKRTGKAYTTNLLCQPVSQREARGKALDIDRKCQYPGCAGRIDWRS
jgi:hypothetical protein